MAKKPVVLALDLGGSNVRWAVVSRQGDILARWEKATASLTEQDSIIQGLTEVMLASAEEARSQGVDVMWGVDPKSLPDGTRYWRL